jgi:hypothetical protein
MKELPIYQKIEGAILQNNGFLHNLYLRPAKKPTESTFEAQNNALILT